MSRSSDEPIVSLLRRYDLSPIAAGALRVLLDLLTDPQAPTSVHDPGRGLDVHIADSLAGLEIPDLRAAGLIADLGSGAGMPGLVLAAVLPDADFVLVEAAARRCDYLRTAIAAMGLDNAHVLWTRAEEWRDGIGRCDVVCARALAALPVLCEYAAPLLREEGVLVAWKGEVSELEAADTEAAAEHLGLMPEQIRSVTPFPGSARRTLHVLRKVGPTPAKYPRRPGVATKRPLSAKTLRCKRANKPQNALQTPDPPHPPIASTVAMGIVYAIANQKGGVGKTTTAVNVAACIAEAGYETLLVDVDPQGNATVGIGADRHEGLGLYDVLSGDAQAVNAVRATPVERLSLLASTPDLAGATMELPRLPGSETRLRDALAPARGAYAYTLLDCPPSLGPLTVNALVAADRVIVPVQTEYFALEGLAGLLDTLALIQRELNPRLTVAGMLLTMHDARTKLGQDVEAEVRRHFPSLVFDTVIPRNVRLGEAPSFGRPVIHHDPHCAGSDAYFELVKEVAARG